MSIITVRRICNDISVFCIEKKRIIQRLALIICMIICIVSFLHLKVLTWYISNNKAFASNVSLKIIRKKAPCMLPTWKCAGNPFQRNILTKISQVDSNLNEINHCLRKNHSIFSSILLTTYLLLKVKHPFFLESRTIVFLTALFKHINNFTAVFQEKQVTSKAKDCLLLVAGAYLQTLRAGQKFRIIYRAGQKYQK